MGKGLLFDTGGYNIKRGMMELMKFELSYAISLEWHDRISSSSPFLIVPSPVVAVVLQLSLVPPGQ